jgi:hypothetical protein
MANLEEIIEPHPLDRVGSAINRILSRDHDLITTTGGVTRARAVRIGDVSIFLARYNGKDRNSFIVGVDGVEDEEFTPLTDDFRWNIHHPEDAEEDVIRNVRKLEQVIEVVSRVGI